MNQFKKVLKVIFTVLLVVVCLFSVIQKMFIMPIRNVFDEMYYAGEAKEMSSGDFIQWGSYITGCSYKNVSSLEAHGGRDLYDKYIAGEFHQFHRDYERNELNPDETISIRVFFNERRIKYTFTVISGEKQSLVWFYDYLVEEKTMYVNGPTLYFSEGEKRLSTTDEEQIAAFLQENGYGKTAEEYEHYFLYDKIIHDWTMGNLFRSKYATWWIGSVKFVDGPPPSEAV